MPATVRAAVPADPGHPAGDPAGSAGEHAPLPADVRIFCKQNYYTSEKNAHIVVHASDLPTGASLRLTVASGGSILIQDAPVAEGRTLHPVAMDLLPLGKTDAHCSIASVQGSADGPGTLATATVALVKHPPKSNEVKIDRETGGFIVDGRPFFPFGFYCYTHRDQTQEHLLEAEVVKGFNMVSPYQTNAEEYLAARKAYMDRCAKLGLRVHYHLQALAGGGGVLGRTPAGFQEGMRRLEAEVKAFRDHPALLAWYIADEPGGRNMKPEQIQPHYELIKELDPYHPVTIVFIHLGPAVEFASTFDVVMTDPYVIPGRAPAQVAEVAKSFVSAFRYRAPLILVPQAFGGNEWWKREPTRQELRAMTYLAVIHRATGIQYFIRSGLNSFPKSTAVWNEAGMIAEEMRELTPWLLSSEPRPEVRADPDSIHVSAGLHEGTVAILAANTHRQPRTMSISIPGHTKTTGEAYALFEDRRLPITHGVLTDMIDGYGTRAYRISTAPGPAEGPVPHPANVASDPSFEDCPSVGIPAHCYAQAGRGATYWVDSTEKIHGLHSLRLHSPTEAEGVNLDFYPVKLQPGRSYVGTVWAKGRPGETASFRLSLGHVGPGGSATFSLTDTWTKYVVHGTRGEGGGRTGYGLGMDSSGTGWFDLLEIRPDPEIICEGQFVEETFVDMRTMVPGGTIRYTLDDSEPVATSPAYGEVLTLTETSGIRFAVFKNGSRISGIESALCEKVK